MVICSSSNIKLLPEHLIDQIKAGEVIERSASLIKEIVENSIDAEATKIEIHIVNNGLDLISVIDNGIGMKEEDLPYAFCRHATSKISKFEDLYSLHSFGFRGEALASISSISRVTCTSSPKENNGAGGKIEIHGGKEIFHSSYHDNKHGTSLFIKDLFFNTPVRLKFVKSKTSEKNAIKKILHGFVLSNPQVSFSIKWDDKDKDLFPATDERNNFERVKSIFYKNKRDQNKYGLVEFSNEYDGYKVEGVVTEDASRGRSQKSQFILMNGRIIDDKSLVQAVIAGMNKLWMPGETGQFFISLIVPPMDVDVNVHPSKTAVKFKNHSTVFSLISSSIAKSIKDLAPADANNGKRDFRSSSDVSWISGNSNNESTRDMSSQNDNIGKESIFNLTDQYLVISIEHKNYICDINHLLALYFKKVIESSFPVDSSNVTPILIANSFRISINEIEHNLGLLKNMGFELNKLDEESIVLRTIPTDLDMFTNHRCVESLISLCSKNTSVTTKYELDDLIDKLYMLIKKSTFNLDEYQLKKMVGLIDTNTLVDTCVLVELEDDKIKYLFDIVSASHLHPEGNGLDER